MQHSTESKVDVPEEFAKKSDLKTKALEVNGELLWVCPQVLASKSPVFHRIFFGEYLDKESDIVPVKDKILKDFIYFLQCLNGSPEAFNSQFLTNYPAILKLADEFHVSSLVEIIFNQLLPKLEEFKSDVGKNAVEILEIVTLAYQFKHQQTIDSYFPIYCQVPYKIFKENYESLPPELRELYLMNRADYQPDLSRFPPSNPIVSQCFSEAKWKTPIRMEFVENKPIMANQETSILLGYVGGFQWELLVMYDKCLYNDLRLFLKCGGDQNDGSWNCTTIFSIKLLAQVDSVLDIGGTELKHTFKNGYYQRCRGFLYDLDVMMYPKKGYIRDDSIVVEVVLQILKTSSKEGLLINEKNIPVSAFVDKEVKNLFQKNH